MIYITRKEHFNAAHKLYNHQWSEEENLKIFGKCANPNFHGHNYDLYVTIKGHIDSQTGFVMNFFDLRDILQKEVIDLLDHKNLNIDIDYFKKHLPSVENLCIFVWNLIEPKIRQYGVELHCVKIWETDSNFAEYYGR